MPRPGSTELAWFALVLALVLGVLFHESLIGGKILSPADVLLVEASFRPGIAGEDADEPRNRLLMDPVLQFQPWLEFNRAMLRQGQLPLWNPYAGCGAPHLANGQSAVFDPFHLIAYLTTVPRALGWMAFARLWVAGLGAFLLARWWELGGWGRWFAGLVYPLCGFLMAWLLYPVTPVAIWLPWLLLATDRVCRAPGPRTASLAGIVVVLVILGGHIQTTAHVLMASGLLAGWRVLGSGLPWRGRLRPLAFWAGGVALGLLASAVQIVPLWSYLGKSPVWEDRRKEMDAWWKPSRPRLAEAACTAFPYIYGSQRRGQPNLARRLGVNNLNESAGGYAGLATLIWLAPLGFRTGRGRTEPRYLGLLIVLGALGAFRLPPVDNLLRALPVLEVTDNRRLVLWVAFGLSLLGGFGLDAVARGARLRGIWAAGWIAGAIAFGTTALLIPRVEERLRGEAERHVRSTPAASSLEASRLHARAARQVRAAVSFLPRYYGAIAVELACLGGLALAPRRWPRLGRAVPPLLLGLTVLELGLFGYGLNPAIPPAVQAYEPPVVARLRARLGCWGRALGIGEELPPNVLMRFDLGDPRNYDSIELARSLDWFAPLFEPGADARTSRRTVTWDGVVRARRRLEAAGVGAAVSATPPPAGQFERVERSGAVWIAWLDGSAWATAGSPTTRLAIHREAARARIEASAASPDRLVIRETWDPGWRARLDGREVRVDALAQMFLAVHIPEGTHVIELFYAPSEMAYAGIASVFGGLGLILGLTGWRGF